MEGLAVSRKKGFRKTKRCFFILIMSIKILLSNTNIPPNVRKANGAVENILGERHVTP